MGCGVSGKDSHSNPSLVDPKDFSLRKEAKEEQAVCESEAVAVECDSPVREAPREANEELEELNKESIVNCGVPPVYISAEVREKEEENEGNLKAIDENEVKKSPRENKAVLGLSNLKPNSEFKPSDKKLRGKIVTGVEYVPQLRPEYSGKSLRSEKLDAVLENTYNPKEDSDDEFVL
eukprot:TRINITY_DN15432_c0_g1_i1.p1 TRINITY_DN15432_c0_g1~~TRINITY_DN15432_c0_g1_i1.p1  ORF type:complete len:178 (-),score=53.87 TRINITY_DN15432_c0_g1_i1:86-619(-)